MDSAVKPEIVLIESNVAALYASPIISIEQIILADKFLQNLLKETRSWLLIDPILSTVQNLETSFFALLVVEGFIKSGWNAVSATFRSNMARLLLKLIYQFSSRDSPRKEKYFANKLNFVLVQALKREQPSVWKNIIDDLLEEAYRNENFCKSCLDILQLLSEEIFENPTSEMTEMKLTSFQEYLHSVSNRISGLCWKLLANSGKDGLIRATLTALNSFLTWIPLSYAFELSLVEMLLIDNIFSHCYINLTLPCLIEITRNLKNWRQYNQRFLNLYPTFIKQLKSLYPDPTLFGKHYGLATNDEKGIVRNLALFLSSFYKSHILDLELSLCNMDLLKEGHQYLLCISLVDDDYIFEVCLDYWYSLVLGLQYTSKSQHMIDQRRHFYEEMGLLSKLRLLMIRHMPPKLEDYDLDHYEYMSKTLSCLTNLNYEDTKTQMMGELRERRHGWTSNNVHILWAITSISGMMQEILEHGFFADVYYELKTQFADAKGSKEKACVGYIMMYACGEFAWWFGERLTTLVPWLSEIMCHTSSGIQDAACTTFLMVFQKCQHNFAMDKMRESFLSELLERLTAVAPLTYLEPDQIHSLYESAGHMIRVENNTCRIDKYLERLMYLPQKQLGESIQKLSIRQLMDDVNSLEVQEVTRALIHTLQIISRVAGSLGDYFLGHIKQIFPHMIFVYRKCSEHISSVQGSSRTYFVALLRSLKREILKLGPLFEKAEGQNGELYVEWMFFVLKDYARNSPDARESEVLSLCATFINKYKEIVSHNVLGFEVVLGCTVEMITNNMEDYPEHRYKFFSLVEVTAADFIFALINLSRKLLDHVMYAILWAFWSPQPDIAEAGLTTLLKLLEKLESSTLLNKFGEAYFVWIVQATFDVLTDTLHKSGFELHVQVLQQLCKLMRSAEFEERLWTCNYFPYPDNKMPVLYETIVFLRSSFPNINRVKLTSLVRKLFGDGCDSSTFRCTIQELLLLSQEISAEVYVGDPDFDNDPFFDIVFSWLKKLRACVLPVRHQGPADSCWALVASDTIFSVQVIANPDSVAYLPSVQDLIDRVPFFRPPTDFIEVGEKGLPNIVIAAYRYADVFGIYPDDKYAPYEPLYCCRTAYKAGEKCREHILKWQPSKNDNFKVFADGHRTINPRDVREIRSQLLKQPLAATLMATKTFKNWKSDDVYRGGPARDGDFRHAVTLIGFGGIVGVNDYFLIKNSWGKSWGHFGYAKVSSDQILTVCYPTGCCLRKAP